MLNTLEQQFETFIIMAKDVGLDVSIAENTRYSFVDVKTNAAWMIFGWAYGLGSRHMIVEVFK